MTKAERVVLAVKCCFGNGETDCSYGGKPCPYIRKPSCNRALGEDTIDVIERQQKEIERLKAETEKAFISGQNNILETQAEFLSSIRKGGDGDG